MGVCILGNHVGAWKAGLIMASERLQIRLDGQVKTDAERVAAELGLSLGAIVLMTLKQLIRDEALPFAPTAVGARELDDIRKEGVGNRAKKASENGVWDIAKGYDTSMWMNLETLKQWDGTEYVDDMDDPTIFSAYQQWKHQGTDPYETLTRAGWTMMTLVRKPRRR